MPATSLPVSYPIQHALGAVPGAVSEAGAGAGAAAGVGSGAGVSANARANATASTHTIVDNAVPRDPYSLAGPAISPGFTPAAAASRPTRTGALTLEARRAFGALLPVLDWPELRDMMIQVVRSECQLWVDHGGVTQQLPCGGLQPNAVRALAVNLIAAGGRHIDELHPCADVRLGDGIRVHAVLPPASVGGAAISIRVPRIVPLGFEQLAEGDFCSRAQARMLRSAVLQKRNLLVTGSTGSGKTTVLAALLDLVPPHERVITIEDVTELRLTRSHWIALEARQANSEGVGALLLDQLLREALRMRPDRIVLGECRGAEVLTLLAALNTGHDGGAGTLHASSLADVPARLEALGALGGLSPAALARQVCSALHYVVHLERAESGRHRLVEIGQFYLDRDVLAVERVRV